MKMLLGVLFIALTTMPAARASIFSNNNTYECIGDNKEKLTILMANNPGSRAPVSSVHVTLQTAQETKSFSSKQAFDSESYILTNDQGDMGILKLASIYIPSTCGGRCENGHFQTNAKLIINQEELDFTCH